MNNIIEKLKEVVNFLNKENINLSKNNKDGRINSIKNEEEILKILLKKYEFIKQTNTRDWADFFIDQYPINIKITEGNTNDNMSSKKGLYYSLTGLNCNYTDWEKFLKSLKNNIKDVKTDYYFLVMFKNNNQFFYNSLKKIRYLTPNGNNLPFQINWSKNKEPYNMNFEDSKKNILTTLGLSLKKRSMAYESFKNYFENYL